MNIYDFDNTIYDGDSNRDIIIFGLKKHFKITFRALKRAKKMKKDYEMGLVEIEKIKEVMLSFIFQIDNYQEFIKEFVDTHMKKIKPWYLSRKTQNDIIISASYDLWIKEFAKRLGIRGVIATRVDLDGKILGRNCKAEEKVLRFKQVFPDEEVLSAYADEESDLPMMRLARTSYVVDGNKLIQYTTNYKFKKNKQNKKY